MTKTTITPLPDPMGFLADPLTDVLRSGARRLIEQVVEAELAALLAAHADDKTEDGRSRGVRHGHLPEREIMTGIDPVSVKVPRVRDRGDGEKKVRFTSAILPPSQVMTPLPTNARTAVQIRLARDQYDSIRTSLSPTRAMRTVLSIFARQCYSWCV